MALSRFLRRTYEWVSRQKPAGIIVAGSQMFCAYHLFAEYGYVAKTASGPSMLPTLDAYESLVISKRHRRGRDIAVGDLVAYDIPLLSGAEGIKRVGGMPGDYVLLQPPLDESPFSPAGIAHFGPADARAAARSHATAGPGPHGEPVVMQVPKGHCWLVGDNLSASRDSRTYGPVPLALVRGKVIGRWKDWFSFEWFENPLVPKTLD